MFPLSRANQLVELNGVWVEAGTAGAPDFSYSDGSEQETYLREVLESAKDLSSLSEELESRIRDWPSEYHLTSKRANLLRGFSLKGIDGALELGCGCGAISRYLGEQGIKVDAIEGSRVRAQIASIRCRDLEQVNIVNANFNNLALPENAYDAVFLVGVMEYAARFSAKSDSSVEAVQKIFSAARRCLKPGGIVFVAIENRLGLKYLLGSTEDHYGVPYIGIHDYPGDGDIRTYDKSQWHELIRTSGFAHYRCYYPFPDYKIPTLVLSDGFLERERYAASLLATTKSRDYLRALPAEADETVFWKALHQAQSVPGFSNSYLWVLSDSDVALQHAGGFDFVHLAGTQRRRGYRTRTIKYEGSKQVSKELLDEGGGSVKGTLIQQVTSSQDYMRGELLSEVWARIVSIYENFVNLLPEVKRYYEFLQESGAKGVPLYDLLPGNIIVAEDGEYRVFDNEWQTVEPAAPEFVLYRALMNFCAERNDRLAALFDRERLDSYEQFIIRCCQGIGVNMEGLLYDYVSLDDRIQSEIHYQRNPDLSIRLLQGRPGSTGTAGFYYPRIYWAGPEGDYDESRVVEVTAGIGQPRQSLEFVIPGHGQTISEVRFDPAEQEGYFHLYSMNLILRKQNGEERTVEQLSTPQGIAKSVRLVNVIQGEGIMGTAWYASSVDPALILRLGNPIQLDAGDRLLFSVVMDWPKSADYLLIKNEYENRVDRMQAKLEAQEQEINRLREAERELGVVKNSRVWRVAEQLRRWFYFGVLQRFPFWQAIMLTVSRRGLRQGLGRLTSKIRQVSGEAAGDGIPAPAGEIEQQQTEYDRQAALFFRNETELEYYRKRILELKQRPKISILMPVYNADPAVLRRAVDSVLDQVYENWELCIADDASTRKETVDFLKTIHHPRIKIRYLTRNRNISGATNAASESADGDYLALLDNDDELTPDALYHMVSAINETGADVLYSDEDFINTEGKLENPHFKPDLSPHLLLSHNYITHLLVFRRELFRQIGGLRSEYDGAQDYDLALRLSETAEKIVHVPRVLYHWRMSPHSTSFDADAKPGALAASQAAIKDALRRRHIRAEVRNANQPHFYRVKPELPAEQPLVSIIIPFRDKPGLLKTCIESILEKSSYQNYEIVGISNGSELPETFDLMKRLGQRDQRVRFSECNDPFNFSHLVNYGASQAKGSHLIILNNDIEVISWDWIESMLEYSQQSDVGVVGCKLYYPDNTIQHAGIIVGIGGYAGHAHKNFQAGRFGYFNRLHVLQDVSAVTGACMMVKTTIFNEVGGFDEDHLGVACNDVDFCLRVREKGYWNVFTPYAELYHYESKSRGYEDTVGKKARFEREKAWFRQRHAAVLKRGDPFYNPNLSLDAEDFRKRI